MKLTDEEFARLRDYMYQKFGINLAHKRVLIEGRLSMTLQKRGYENFTDYINDIMADKSGAEVSHLVSKLTTNFTYFLREEGHYDFMSEVILPEFTHRPLSEFKIWSAASSSGEEPYSIAMVCDNFLGPLNFRKVSITASDISNSVLEQAKAGVYALDKVSKLPEGWKDKYFNKTPQDEYSVKDTLRRNVNFKYFNLNDSIGWTLRTYDLVFCRNVMIYFDQATRQKVTQRLYDSVKPGGYLFIGMSETLVNVKTEFEYIKPSIYKRKA